MIGTCEDEQTASVSVPPAIGVKGFAQGPNCDIILSTSGFELATFHTQNHFIYLLDGGKTDLSISSA